MRYKHQKKSMSHKNYHISSIFLDLNINLFGIYQYIYLLMTIIKVMNMKYRLLLISKSNIENHNRGIVVDQYKCCLDIL